MIRPSRASFEFVYFLGITGAGHTLLTPNIGRYGFPHIHFFLTLVGHAGIVLAAVYLTFVEGYRPTWKSLWQVFGWANLFMVGIFFLNRAIGSNYMYVSHKPETPSLMDLMGPWPWYILVLEAVALMHMLALDTPFAIADARVPVDRRRSIRGPGRTRLVDDQIVQQTEHRAASGAPGKRLEVDQVVPDHGSRDRGQHRDERVLETPPQGPA